MAEPTTTTATEPRSPYMLRKGIGAVKEAVRIEDYARTLTTLRFAGNSLRGRCPIHRGDNTESFAVYSDKGRFCCYRCGAGGDVVDLAQAAENHAEVWTAMLSLATRYNVELPKRPNRWHEWNAEKGKRCDELQRWRARRYQRRFYRLFAAESVASIGDERERAEEAGRCWDELGALARAWAARSMGGAK